MKIAGYILILTIMLLGPPLAGIWLAGHDPALYLEFPPLTQHVEHAPFCWLAFIGLVIAIVTVAFPFTSRIAMANALAIRKPTMHRTYPWWGWLAIGFGILFWIFAWTRFAWFEPLQLYTFTPQWFAYIVAVNALTFRRSGRCLLTHETKFLLLLFPLSAVFWWFFEYLNRFVQNWCYVGCEHFSSLQYFTMATLSFSTVLPAVLSTEEWLAANPRNSNGLQFNAIIWPSNFKAFAWATLIGAVAGLFFIGWFPDYLFPLLWVAPLLLLVALQELLDRPSLFPEVQNGDWRRVYRFALAALICGFFWELWNWHSLAKWIYSVPFVDRFHLFEMPILGYAGYLPFGLECAVVANLIRSRQR